MLRSTTTSASADFSFGFLNPKFSDAKIRLGVGRDGAAEEADPPFKILPVNALLLSGKSDYFKQLFSGEFREGVEMDVKILLPSDSDVQCFQDILYHVYSGRFPSSWTYSIPSNIQALRLSDRFGFLGTFDHYAEVLAEQSEDFTFEDSVDLVEIHHCSKGRKSLHSAMYGARYFILSQIPAMVGTIGQPKRRCPEGGKKMKRPYTGTFFKEPKLKENFPTKEFLELSEAVVTMVLEDDSVEVPREDILVDAGLAWVSHNCTPGLARLRAFSSVLLRGLRVQHASPTSIMRLFDFLVANFRSIEPSLTQEKTHSINSVVGIVRDSQGTEWPDERTVEMARNVFVASQCLSILALVEGVGEKLSFPQAWCKYERIKNSGILFWGLLAG